MEKQNILISSVLLFIGLFATGLLFWTSIGLAYSVYIFLNFAQRIGNGIPIPQLMLLIAASQWILGPWIDYITPATHYLYHMYVPEDQYMAYAVPAILAMHIGIHLYNTDISMQSWAQKTSQITVNYPSLPYLLILVGLVLPFISRLFPVQLAFIFYLLSNIKYIGVIYLLFSRNKNRWFIFIGLMLFTLIASIASGMFHEFILWGILTFTFVSYELKMSFTYKLMSLAIGALFIITLQAIKPKVRDYVWKGDYKGNELALFINLSVQEWSQGTIFNPSNQNDINVRLNQGWIISKIMQNVPQNQNYSNGSTITEAISASLLPRFLNPNKSIAGGRKNFEKYTGLELALGTSMGISLAGEGWANFGYWGGILFLLGWGLFVGWFWQFLQKKSSIYPTLLIWSPLIFQQVIKAETELLDVLNHLVKAAILVFILLWFFNKQLGVKL